MPAKTKPFSVSPSMTALRFVPAARAVSSDCAAPLYSSFRYFSENGFLRPRTVSRVVKPVTTESVSAASMMACFAFGWRRHSSERRKRVPICTPEAPMRRAAAMARPSTMPPAATTGISISGRTFSRRAMRVILPSCRRLPCLRRRGHRRLRPVRDGRA